MKNLGDRLRFARHAAGMTQQAVADALGINRVSVSAWESNDSRPDPDRIPTILALLGTTYEWLWEGKGSAPSPREEANSENAQPPSVPLYEGPLVVRGGSIKPIYMAATGSDGDLSIALNAIGYQPPPSELFDINEAFGILIADESMSPALEPGDVAWVNPKLGLRRQANGLFIHADSEEDHLRAKIKRLVSWSQSEWKVRQYQPARDFSLSRKEWPTFIRIVFNKYRGDF